MENTLKAVALAALGAIGTLTVKADAYDKYTDVIDRIEIRLTAIDNRLKEVERDIWRK